MNLDKAEELARDSEYARLATHQDDNPINWGDAAAFFAEGVKWATSKLEDQQPETHTEKSVSDEQAVIEYELSRQAVSELDKRRRHLVGRCNGVEDNDRCCLVRAVKERELMHKDNPGSYYSYGEVLDEMDPPACQTCLGAYELKHGDLAQAKQRFGKAKRSLSVIGKRLIREKREES